MRQLPHISFPPWRDLCEKPRLATRWTSRSDAFRQLLPDGKARSGFAAADGQWTDHPRLYGLEAPGDNQWLETMWPRIKKGLSLPGFWRVDANRDGVLDGVQHNTYE